MREGLQPPLGRGARSAPRRQELGLLIVLVGGKTALGSMSSCRSLLQACGARARTRVGARIDTAGHMHFRRAIVSRLSDIAASGNGTAVTQTLGTSLGPTACLERRWLRR